MLHFEAPDGSVSCFEASEETYVALMLHQETDDALAAHFGVGA